MAIPKTPTSVTCPRCDRTSYNPDDVVHGFCGYCRDWTSAPLLQPDQEMLKQLEEIREMVGPETGVTAVSFRRVPAAIATNDPNEVDHILLQLEHGDWMTGQLLMRPAGARQFAATLVAMANEIEPES